MEVVAHNRRWVRAQWFRILLAVACVGGIVALAAYVRVNACAMGTSRHAWGVRLSLSGDATSMVVRWSSHRGATGPGTAAVKWYQRDSSGGEINATLQPAVSSDYRSPGPSSCVQVACRLR